MNRWWIAVASVVMQMALGAFYAWSVFVKPLNAQFGWSVPQVTLAFTLSVFGLGTGAFWGGLLMNRKGPRLAAMVWCHSLGWRGYFWPAFPQINYGGSTWPTESSAAAVWAWATSSLWLYWRSGSPTAEV